MDPKRGQEGSSSPGTNAQGGTPGRVFNPGEPRLIVKEQLDRETQALYKVIVTAYDGGGAGGGRSKKLISQELELNNHL